MDSERISSTDEEMVSLYEENLSPAPRPERFKRELSRAQRPLEDPRDNRIAETDPLIDIHSKEMDGFVDDMLRKMKREKNARKVVEDSEDEV